MPSRNERRQDRYGKRNDRIRLSKQTNWKRTYIEQEIITNNKLLIEMVCLTIDHTWRYC